MPQLSIDTNLKELLQEYRQLNGIKNFLNIIKTNVLISTASDLSEKNSLRSIDGMATRLAFLISSWRDVWKSNLFKKRRETLQKNNLK